MKLLSAVGLGKPICSEEWVLHSKTENDFLGLFQISIFISWKIDVFSRSLGLYSDR